LGIVARGSEERRPRETAFLLEMRVISTSTGNATRCVGLTTKTCSRSIEDTRSKTLEDARRRWDIARPHRRVRSAGSFDIPIFASKPLDNGKRRLAGSRRMPERARARSCSKADGSRALAYTLELSSARSRSRCGKAEN